MRHRYRHDRISVISAVSISAERKRFGLYFQLHGHNIRALEVLAFLRALLRHLRGPVIVLWDNASIHKGALMRKLCQRVSRLHLEPLPRPDPGVGRWPAPPS